MVAPGQQRRPRRGAERGGVEAVVFEPARRQLFGVRRLAGAAKGACSAEPGVVDQDDQHVGRTLRRAQLLDRREFGVRVPRVIGDQPGSLGRGDRQMRTVFLVFAAHRLIALLRSRYEDENFCLLVQSFSQSSCRYSERDAPLGQEVQCLGT